MAVDGRKSHREGYPGICTVVGGMDPWYATHPGTDTIDEQRRACPCRPLPMERDKIVSTGPHPNRGVVYGHRLVQGKGRVCEGRAWSCRHPRGKGMAFYPLQGQDRHEAGATEQG